MAEGILKPNQNQNQNQGQKQSELHSTVERCDTACAGMRRYNSCPTKHQPDMELSVMPNDQDYDSLLLQEEERLREQRLQYHLRVLELERKKMDRLRRSRKQESMKKVGKFRITTISPVDPV